NLHEILRKRIAASPSLAIKELCARVLKDLGLPETFLNPNVVASIEAHLKEMRHQDLLKVSS
ncbi:MAG: MBL fold metallo-hydrolase, partial [Pseudomonadota bacterium]